MWEFTEGGWSVLETGEFLFGEREPVFFCLFAVVFILFGAFGGGVWV